jgi:hypothetical protein
MQKHQKQAPPHELFDAMVETYLGGVLQTGNGLLELEVRFGTRNLKRVASITKIDFDNVIKTLLSAGYVMEKTDDYTLKINSEIADPHTGKPRMADIRTEIAGLHNIQMYCRTNSLDKVHPVFVQKTGFHPGESPESIPPVNFDDFNFRLSLQTEKQFAESSTAAKTVVTPWRSSRKTFRYLNRSTFRTPALPFRVDMSIVKESRRDHGSSGMSHMIPTHTFAESQLTDSQPKYEIEIEVVNDAVGQGTAFNTARKLADALRSCVKTVLSGLQGTNYPVGAAELALVANEYMRLLHPEKFVVVPPHLREKDNEKKEPAHITMLPKHFAGPSSYTLQLQNIVPVNENCTVPNVRNNYTVTDKADGARKLLYICPSGRIYFIDTNMRFQFTGAQSDNKKLFYTLLDGEHILHDKNGRFINLFAAFDVYYIAGKDMRALHFVPPSAEAPMSKFRLPLLVEAVNELKVRSVVRGAAACPVRIEYKKFKSTGADQSIFQCCATLMAQLESSAYEYNTDGMIFTPADAPVGGEAGSDVAGPKTKITWSRSFKWKPTEANTIDFLATLVKDPNGQPKVTSIYTDGVNVAKADQIVQFKTLTLRVGFDEKKHGYLNPCEDVIQGKLPSRRGANERGGAGGAGASEDSYKPVPFYPTSPYDPDAHVCNVILRTDAAGNRGMMLTAENEAIEDGTIIECAYNAGAADPRFRWVPLRVRTDKTAEYRSGQKNYGNAYHVANSNWHTIHHPITKQMLTTGLNIPEELGDDDVYYNRTTSSGDTSTRGLRDFHNLVVKRALIGGASRRGNTLIDFAVGKGGDLPKWIHAHLSFVLGVDISKDNIQNQLDGACARYLDYCKRFSIMPGALFVQGNSALNIKSGTGISGEKYKQIVRAVFGDGPKDKAILGEGVYREYGKAENGFNVSSCQFAIHYMFETRANVCNFLRNVCECTQVGGYFIGTTYDGATMFDALKSDDGIAVMHNGTRVWQVTKAYTATEFPDDETCVGYAIDVYQESINKTFREYLVNFNYLKRLMANFGFEVVPRDDALKDLGLPDGTGMFEQLHAQMMARIKQTPALAADLGDAPDMRDYERRISFYNRYFVFKKVRSIDNAELVVKSLLGTSTLFEKQMAALEQEQQEQQEQQEPEAAAAEVPKPSTKPTTKPTKPPTKPRAKPAATAATAAATDAIAATGPATDAATGPATGEKKKPGRKTKIQLVVKERPSPQ